RPRTPTLFPYTTLFRSIRDRPVRHVDLRGEGALWDPGAVADLREGQHERVHPLPGRHDSPPSGVPYPAARSSRTASPSSIRTGNVSCPYGTNPPSVASLAKVPAGRYAHQRPALPSPTPARRTTSTPISASALTRSVSVSSIHSAISRSEIRALRALTSHTIPGVNADAEIGVLVVRRAGVGE